MKKKSHKAYSDSSESSSGSSNRKSPSKRKTEKYKSKKKSYSRKKHKIKSKNGYLESSSDSHKPSRRSKFSRYKSSSSPDKKNSIKIIKEDDGEKNNIIISNINLDLSKNSYTKESISASKSLLTSTLRNASIAEYSRYCQDLAAGKIETTGRDPFQVKPEPPITRPNNHEPHRLSEAVPKLPDSSDPTDRAQPRDPSSKTSYPISSGQIHQFATVGRPTQPGSSYNLAHSLTASAIAVGSDAAAPAISLLKDFNAKQSEETETIQRLVWMRGEYIRILETDPYDQMAQHNLDLVERKISEWEGIMAINKPRMIKKNGIYVVESPYDLPQDYMMLEHNYVPSEFALRLMCKMGWSEGKTLGREQKDIHDTPQLRVEIKNDRIGLGTFAEIHSNPALKDILSKHPVSSLQEICQKMKWPNPEYIEVSALPFLVKVVVKGRSFVPTSKSNTKKDARLQAALYALECLGYNNGSSSAPSPQTISAATRTSAQPSNDLGNPNSTFGKLNPPKVAPKFFPPRDVPLSAPKTLAVATSTQYSITPLGVPSYLNGNGAIPSKYPQFNKASASDQLRQAAPDVRSTPTTTTGRGSNAAKPPAPPSLVFLHSVGGQIITYVPQFLRTAHLFETGFKANMDRPESSGGYLQRPADPTLVVPVPPHILIGSSGFKKDL